MSKKSIVSHEKEFRTWLKENGVGGKKSDASYMTYIRQAKGATGDSIDVFFDRIINEAIQRKITLLKFADNKDEDDVKDSKSALKKYWDFIQYKAGMQVDITD